VSEARRFAAPPPAGEEVQEARLAPPAVRYARSYLAAMREGFYRGVQPPLPEARIRAIEADFERYIAGIAEQTGTITLPNGEVVPKVPFTVLWLVEGDEFIGEVSIRHRLNAWLLQEGGNIGYGIRPSRQRRGYGRLILALALEECRRLGLERVLVTALAANRGSVRIIEANGGRLENQIDAPSGDGLLRRYWITLRDDG
jgi:predicted acetyltransferase